MLSTLPIKIVSTSSDENFGLYNQNVTTNQNITPSVVQNGNKSDKNVTVSNQKPVSLKESLSSTLDQIDVNKEGQKFL